MIFKNEYGQSVDITINGESPEEFIKRKAGLKEVPSHYSITVSDYEWDLDCLVKALGDGIVLTAEEVGAICQKQKNE